MISRRVYKKPIPMPQVREMMAAERGQHFDPDLLDSFIEGFETFCDIARQHPDDESESEAIVAPAPPSGVAIAVAG
jgi:putative two-component system response regulator